MAVPSVDSGLLKTPAPASRDPPLFGVSRRRSPGLVKSIEKLVKKRFWQRSAEPVHASVHFLRDKTHKLAARVQV